MNVRNNFYSKKKNIFLIVEKETQAFSEWGDPPLNPPPPEGETPPTPPPPAVRGGL